VLGAGGLCDKDAALLRSEEEVFGIKRRQDDPKRRIGRKGLDSIGAQGDKRDGGLI